MALVADYLVIRDTAFTLYADPEKKRAENFGVPLPAGFRADRRAVLGFVVDPRPSPGVRLQVFGGPDDDPKRVPLINEYRFMSEALRAVWEAFVPQKVGWTVGTRTLEFIAWPHGSTGSPDTGSLSISDIVLWFKRDA